MFRLISTIAIAAFLTTAVASLPMIPVTPPPVVAAVFYVDVGLGSDANNGLTPATAFQTIQAAVNAAPISPPPSDTTQIFVNQGVYEQTVTINGKNNMNLKANGRVVLQPPPGLPNPLFNNCLTILNATSVTVDGFYFTFWPQYGMWVNSHTNLLVRNCYFRQNGSGIGGGTILTSMLEFCTFRGNGFAGFICTTLTNSQIRNSTFYGNGTAVYSNFASGNQLRNCNFVSNTYVGQLPLGTSNFNNYWANGTLNMGLGPEDIQVDPQFAAFDLDLIPYLKPTSPLLGAGEPVGGLQTNIGSRAIAQLATVLVPGAFPPFSDFNNWTDDLGALVSGSTKFEFTINNTLVLKPGFTSGTVTSPVTDTTIPSAVYNTVKLRGIEDPVPPPNSNSSKVFDANVATLTREVEIRAANTVADVGLTAYTQVLSDQRPVGVSGQYFQVRVTFLRNGP